MELQMPPKTRTALLMFDTDGHMRAAQESGLAGKANAHSGSARAPPVQPGQSGTAKGVVSNGARALAMDLLQIGELEERRATDRFIHTYHGSRSVRRETGLLMHTAEQISISSGIPAQSRQICSLLRQENKEQ